MVSFGCGGHQRGVQGIGSEERRRISSEVLAIGVAGGRGGGHLCIGRRHGSNAVIGCLGHRLGGGQVVGGRKTMKGGGLILRIHIRVEGLLGVHGWDRLHLCGKRRNMNRIDGIDVGGVVQRGVDQGVRLLQLELLHLAFLSVLSSALGAGETVGTG